MGIPEQVFDRAAFGQYQELVALRRLPECRDVVSEHEQGSAL